MAPVVYFIYGGGWNRGDTNTSSSAGPWCAGFVVVIADYRLVPEVTYPGFLEDNANALKWVQDNIATIWRRSQPAVSRRAFGRRL